MIVCIFFTSLIAGIAIPPDDPEPPKPAKHTTRDVQGWTVRVDDRLLSGPDRELGALALGLLDGQLRVIALTLPEDKIKRLREVPIWLDRTHGKLVSPQYHPNPDWLTEHGYTTELAKCVHIPDAAYFAKPRFQREQPSGVLHELAHAYHDQVLGFDDAEIKSAWNAFRDSDRSSAALHVNGEKTPHYARTDPQEFFAEMTESYFGRNDFYPFNSGELKQAEPSIFALLERVWGRLPS